MNKNNSLLMAAADGVPEMHTAIGQ